MHSLSFAVPVKPGMYEEIKAHHDEIVHGLDAEDHHDHHKGRGVRTLQIFYQKEPALLIFHVEAENEEDLTRSSSDPNHPISQTWQQFLAKVAGEDRPRAGRPELLIDWHHHEGHRKRHR